MLGTARVDEEGLDEDDDGDNVAKKVGNYYDGKRLPNWKKKSADVIPKGTKLLGAVQMLQSAATSGRSDALNICKTLILDWQLNPNFRDETGSAALHGAAKSNSLAIARFLCEVKADVDAPSKSRSTPLMKAAEARHAEMVELLADYGADVNQRNEGRATALMLAVINKADKVILTLIRLKADINTQKDVGCTALMLAARSGNVFAVSELVKATANLELRDKRGETALWKAEKRKKQDVVLFLAEQGAVPRPGGQLAKSMQSQSQALSRSGSLSTSAHKSKAAALGQPTRSVQTSSGVGDGARFQAASAKPTSGCASPPASSEEEDSSSESEGGDAAAQGGSPPRVRFQDMAPSSSALGDTIQQKRDAAWHAKWDFMQAQIDECSDPGLGASLDVALRITEPARRGAGK